MNDASMKQKIHFHFDSLMNSYAQVFFSQNKILALLIVIVTFLKPTIGLIGITSVLLANIIVYYLGYQLKTIREGMYGFNVLLLVVALSNLFALNGAFIVLVLVAILLVTIVTISMNHIFERHHLPAVSIPFFICFWMIKLAAPAFRGLEINLDEVYWLNSTYKIGGLDLIKFYNYFEVLPIPLFLLTYLKALGSVFFMPYIFAGILIAIGIFVFSRIAFSISIISYLIAWKGALLFGYNQENLIYGLTGSNIIFCAIGIGCFYLVPSVASYLLAIVLVPITLLVCNTFAAILEPWSLPAMTMPFAFVTVVTLHALRMRWASYYLKFVEIQYYSPEKVVYKSQNIAERFNKFYPIKMQLPVMGKWNVSQGYEGKITHKGVYDKAIDFVIADELGEKTYSADGINLEDYYCYGKPIFAPAAGYITTIENNIDDNKISNVNLEKNWGNSIVIYHADNVYSQLSHLKKDSIKVSVGDYVRVGELLALCGSSGRSPEPHLHYQIQNQPHVGATTIKYPFAYFMETKQGKTFFKQFDIPSENDFVESVQINKLLQEAFYFIPSKKIVLKINENDEINNLLSWEVFTDVYNRTYIYCSKTQSYAYFVNDGTVFYFTDFEGDKNSVLFYFYLGFYKVLLSYHEGLTITDSIPSDNFNNKFIQPIQDFCAPFFKFINADYIISYKSIDDVFNSTKIELETLVKTYSNSIIWRRIEFKIIIENGKISEFSYENSDKKIQTIKWLN